MIIGLITTWLVTKWPSKMLEYPNPVGHRIVELPFEKFANEDHKLWLQQQLNLILIFR